MLIHESGLHRRLFILQERLIVSGGYMRWRKDWRQCIMADRIAEHPILGVQEYRAKVRGFVIGQQLLKIWLHFRCVYRNSVEKGIGTKLNLWDTPKMV